jgi:hypothetical protein
MSKMTVKNIGITRLFSTGRFEHVKISVNAEAGSKPGSELRELQSLIEDLNPNCPIDQYQIDRANNALSEPEDADDIYQMTHEDARKVLDAHAAHLAKREAAYSRLDELGASCDYQEIDNTPAE